MSEVNPYTAPQFAEAAASDNKYNRIGGWLILIAIGLVLTAVMGLFGAASCVLMMAVDEESLSPAFLIYSLFQLGGLGVAAVIGLVLMFRRLRVFPKYMIGYLAATLLLAARSLAVGGVDKDSTNDLIRGVVGCAIWIPYFIRSKRVAGTFVN
jgi:hypothetical protein